MPYSTIDILRIHVGGQDRLVEISDFDKDAEPDVDVIDRAIAAADATINSYVAKQFAVPIANPSPVIVAMSADLAKLNLIKWRRTMTVDEQTELQQHTEWLTQLSDGKVTIDTDPPPPKHSTRVDKVVDRPSTMDVSRSKLGGFW